MPRLRPFLIALSALLLFGTAAVLFARLEKIKGSQESFAKCPPKVVCSSDPDDDLDGDDAGVSVVPRVEYVLASYLPFPAENRGDGRQFFVRLPDRRTATLVGTVLLLI